jgi:hypothetical protein
MVTHSFIPLVLEVCSIIFGCIILMGLEIPVCFQGINFYVLFKWANKIFKGFEKKIPREISGILKV